MNILIVEDEIINLIPLQKGLERRGGIDITIAQNGLEAVEICKNNDFDLVLMDIKMPIMDGYEATKKIKAMKKITIIATTAFELRDIEKEYQNAGFDGFLGKPIETKQLEYFLQKTLQEIY